MTEITCVSFRDYNGWMISSDAGSLCMLDRFISIKEPNVMISNHDESVFGLWFDSNREILNLPIEVAAQFINLLGYSASGCSVKEISYENFKGLTQLNELWLDQNQIEKISDNAFQDLIDLQFLHLGKKIYKKLFETMKKY